MVKTLHFHCRGTGPIPGQGTKISYITCDNGQKKKVNHRATGCSSDFLIRDKGSYLNMVQIGPEIKDM